MFAVPYILHAQPFAERDVDSPPHRRSHADQHGETLIDSLSVNPSLRSDRPGDTRDPHEQDGDVVAGTGTHGGLGPIVDDGSIVVAR